MQTLTLKPVTSEMLETVVSKVLGDHIEFEVVYRVEATDGTFLRTSKYAASVPLDSTATLSQIRTSLLAGINSQESLLN